MGTGGGFEGEGLGRGGEERGLVRDFVHASPKFILDEERIQDFQEGQGALTLYLTKFSQKSA